MSRPFTNKEHGIRQPAAFAARFSRRGVVRAYDEADHKVLPDFLLCALTVMIWTYVWRIQDLFPSLAALKLNLIAAALSIGLFAIDRHHVRGLDHLRTPIFFFALVLVGLTILATPLSLWPRRSATFFMTEFVPNLALMTLLAASIRSLRDVEWIALINVLGACTFALFVTLKFEVGADGRLSGLVYYDANDLALVIVCTIPFAIYFMVRGGWLYRLMGLCGCMLFASTLVKSGSRGGFLGFVAVLAYILVAYSALSKRARLLAVGGAFALLSLVAGDTYWERIRTLRNPQADYNWSGRSTEGRMEVWRRGLRYMVANPVFGVGMRNFAVADGMLSRESKERAERGAGFKWSAAHNSFLEIGVELGVIGLALFVGMLVSAFRALRRIKSSQASKNQRGMRHVALASSLSASLIGFAVSGFFLSGGYLSYVYMLLGVTVGLIKIHRLDSRLVTWPAWHRQLAFPSRPLLPGQRPPRHLRHALRGAFSRHPSEQE